MFSVKSSTAPVSVPVNVRSIGSLSDSHFIYIESMKVQDIVRNAVKDSETLGPIMFLSRLHSASSIFAKIGENTQL